MSSQTGVVYVRCLATAVVSFAALMLSVPASAAECKILPILEIDAPAQGLTDLVSEYKRGMLYLRSDCLDQAAASFESAKSKLPPDYDLVRTLVFDGLELVKIELDLNNGAVAAAQDRFIKLFDQSVISRQTAIDLVGSRLQLETNDKTWARVETAIRSCALEDKGLFWCKNVLARRSIKTRGLAETLKDNDAVLHDAHFAADELQFEIIRADLLIQSGRIAEGTLLLDSLEVDVKTRLNDPAAELLYYTTCVSVWRTRVQASGSTTDVEALKRYEYELSRRSPTDNKR